MTAEEIAQLLGLEPHPEGGFYRRTYYKAAVDSFSRNLSTAIYYLLTPDTFSEMHRLDADEIWHHYLGDPVEQLQIDGKESRIVVIGKDLAAGQRPQLLTPRGVWQGSRVLRERDCTKAHGFALLGTTVAPGFEFAGYEAAVREDLIASCPEQAALITALTRT